MSPRGWAFACCLLASLPGSAVHGAGASESRALALLDRGQADKAAAVFDSLLHSDPADLGSAYWGARAEEVAGHEDGARCRYLNLEGNAPGTPAALLAGARRRALERRFAESILSLGLDRTGPSISQPNLILLPPPDDLGAGPEGHAWSLAWTYLLFEALRGTRLCPVSLPEMLTVLDLLNNGHPVRATRAATANPVNTMAGLRARLALLCSSDGHPYLAGAAASDKQVADALRQFQDDHRLPPTGDANLATQAQVEKSMEEWTSQLPPPLEPKMLGRAAEVTGAAMILRGTYRIELGRVSLQLTLLDPTAAPRMAAPLSLSFPLEQTPARAAEVARILATAPRPAAASTALAPADLQEAARTLLLIDRGMEGSAERRWQTCPKRWFAWPLLAEARQWSSLDSLDLRRLEQGLERGRHAGPVLDATAAQEMFLYELGGSWSRVWPVPRALGTTPPLILEAGPYQIVGRDGLLHVHGNGP